MNMRLVSHIFTMEGVRSSGRRGGSTVSFVGTQKYKALHKRLIIKHLLGEKLKKKMQRYMVQLKPSIRNNSQRRQQKAHHISPLATLIHLGEPELSHVGTRNVV